MAADTERLEALRRSVARLHGIVEALDAAKLDESAYPTEWSIADVLSHLGSGAVIFRERVDSTIAGREMADDFAQSVWDVWNAKPSTARATDALAADRSLLDGLDAMTTAERADFNVTLGPFQLDLAGFLGLRLNEHAIHTWDIEVTLDPGATVPASSVDQIIDTVSLVAGFAGKPIDSARTVRLRTTDPERGFVITVGEATTFGADADPTDVDLVMPAEALIRLVYGRLDPDHAPSVEGDLSALDDLRASFRGL